MSQEVAKTLAGLMQRFSVANKRTDGMETIKDPPQTAAAISSMFLVGLSLLRTISEACDVLEVNPNNLGVISGDQIMLSAATLKLLDEMSENSLYAYLRATADDATREALRARAPILAKQLAAIAETEYSCFLECIDECERLLCNPPGRNCWDPRTWKS